VIYNFGFPDVLIKDINGPKGGVDIQSLIRVRLRNRQVIALGTAHESLYVAVKKGSKQTKRAVRRHLQKSQRMRDIDIAAAASN